MKPSSYSALLVNILPASPIALPIRVAAKQKGRGHLKNVFMDDQGFPDQSDEFDTLLHNIDGGTILRKLKHPQPPIDVPNSQFHFTFDQSIHGAHLKEQLDLSHLDPPTQLAVINLIKKYWSVFDERGVWVPV